MERLIGFLFIAWLAVMAIGIVIALLPVLLVVVGFVGTVALIVFVGRLVGSWLFL
ncbi:hypothetical protein TA3x_005598 [Tundrisphaera sp. TA3]|uniref:hypothetical protein n=1 Tax=Tundrisphaera sp. TA3 TaxID=3435775 RepID=UPI003EBC91E6